MRQTQSEERTTSSQARLRAYLQLMRFPAVFTALADILLGFVLTHESFSPAGDLAALVGASSGLYLAGMVFNDWFDRDLDARERPGRPIPSGRISPRAAATQAPSWASATLPTIRYICTKIRRKWLETNWFCRSRSSRP